MLEQHVSSETTEDHILGDGFTVESHESSVNGPSRVFTPVDRFALEEKSAPANDFSEDDNVSEQGSLEWLANPGRPDEVLEVFCHSGQCSCGKWAVQEAGLRRDCRAVVGGEQ